MITQHIAVGMAVSRSLAPAIVCQYGLFAKPRASRALTQALAMDFPCAPNRHVQETPPDECGAGRCGTPPRHMPQEQEEFFR
ncbi:MULTISPECIES: hypothetical protein [Rhizobium]|uniref:hypothetical protein n=1 Tax=Rhizobium TaxID=379 RepID=UPI0007EB049D|nr:MULTISPECIES: hypothetical protein [Rhizobium]ANK93649.1 hypothetical protein AMK01_CH04260 [Rhizobium sp. N6212]ANK99697.1 hypothetical protein AMK00_CH04263 [Rhizobium sp. N621]ANL05827.1 hypothetical protein AMJ99_CH04341 [Rhizobium esperanzae]ANL11879.1 hypothetical protein AMJ98_CH04291 [Rhizobium sp. N1341]ANM36668.1 hypothetical protein AMK04_CH04347 [Rhizobium sp. N871]